jgi:hypothetical protein
MHLAHLLRSSKQRYIQFSPVLTTVGARTCTTWRFVYVLIAKLCCWLYLHIQSRLNFKTSSGHHCKISLITTGWDCFGCQVTATLRTLRRLIGWRGWTRTPTFVDRDINRRWVIEAHSKRAVDNLSFGLNTQSCKQPNTSPVCPKNSSEFWFLLSRGIVALINISTGWDWQQALFVHLANWKRRRHFTLCVSVRLLQHWEHTFLASS